MDEEAQIRRAVELSLRDSAQKQKRSPRPRRSPSPRRSSEPAAEPAAGLRRPARQPRRGSTSTPAAAAAATRRRRRRLGRSTSPAPPPARRPARRRRRRAAAAAEATSWRRSCGTSARARAPATTSADVRVGGEWQRFNDDMVQPVTEREVLHGEGRTKGYLYFYVHEGLAGA